MKDPIGIFGCRWGFSISERLPAQSAPELWEGQEEVRAVPISALLARIRKLIPINCEDHYEEIVRGFCNGALRPPPTQMNDRELSRAIADFLKDAPSVEAVGTLGRRLDPSSPL
jgi:hypothetical protein